MSSMTEIQKEKYRTAARERKRKSHEKIKAQKKLTFFRNSFFLFQTKSRAKCTKLQVVSKQVYVREVYGGTSQLIRGYGKSCQHITHSTREFESDKKTF